MTKSKIKKIQYIGKKSEPPTQLINGGKIIELPDAETQRKGFAHEDADFLVQHYRRFYKEKVSKGGRRR